MDNNGQNKIKIQEILDEISNLKKYNKDLMENIRGDRLEGYIENLNKSINALEKKVEIVYEENCKKNNN